MAPVFLMLHLAAICLGVRVVGTYTTHGTDNGHAAKKYPMDYSRYADDVRNIANHDSSYNSHKVNTCDDRFEMKNSTIIRTKDSMYFGAQFVDDTKVTIATECRWQCCQKNEDCDTAVFVDDNTKEKNCFLFKCRIGNAMKCKFSSHLGYVSAMVGGFEVVPWSGTTEEDDNGDDDDDDGDEEEDDKKTGFDNQQDALAPSSEDSDPLPNQGKEAAADDDGCRDDQIQCANGQCIIARYVCNDVEDCTDGSDEMGCKYGSWKQWNNYNHPDNQDGFDDSRGSEMNEDAHHEEDQDSIEDNDASQDKSPVDNMVPTVMDNDKDFQDGPSPSSPKPAVKPVLPVSSAPVSPKEHQDQLPGDMPEVVHSKSEVSTSKSDDLSNHTLRKAISHGIQPAASAILPLAVGLIITLFLLMMLSCRLRYMNRRLRYGRLKTHAHDADYLINGMYL